MKSDMGREMDLSVVVPIFDEAETLFELWRRLVASLDPLRLRYEIVFVDDGSRDESPRILAELRAKDPRVGTVELSRNFGQQLAITAGIDHANGRAVVVMDADLQDPPELLPALVGRWQEGYEVVYAVRRSRREGLLLRLAVRIFYRLVRRLSDVALALDSGDFALLDRRVVDVLQRLPERNRYLRGLRAWAGFRQVGVPYDRPARAAGVSKYTVGRFLRLALDAISAFSDLPLRVVTLAGLGVTALSLGLGAWTLLKHLLGIGVVPGFATITPLLLFFGGAQLVALGIVGEYVGRIYAEVKARPLYVVRATYGLAVRAGQTGPDARGVEAS